MEIAEIELNLVDKADAGIVGAPFLVIAAYGIDAAAAGLIDDHVIPQTMPDATGDLHPLLAVSGIVGFAVRAGRIRPAGCLVAGRHLVTRRPVAEAKRDGRGGVDLMMFQVAVIPVPRRQTVCQLCLKEIVIDI